MIRTSILDGGLQLVTEDMADVRSAALGFWVGTGSRDETTADAGMSHFLEHLLFKGSTTRTALDIAQAIDGVGGDMNAFTTKECTAFHVRVLAEDTELALDILCDIMSNPAFPEREIEAERQVVLEEILMRGDEPADLVHELFDETVFAGHPLGREVLGDEASVSAIDRGGIGRFFDHHYRAANLVFAAAGAIDHDWLVEGVQQRLAGREGGQRVVRQAPAPQLGHRKVHAHPSDQAHLVLGVAAPHRHDPRRYTAALLDAIVGGGMSSRLFQEVRERRGLAYSVYSSYTPYSDTGELTFYVGTAPRRVPEALEVVGHELEQVRKAGVTPDELARAKRNLHATTALGLEDSGARMGRIGRSLLLHGDVLTTEEVAARLDAVTVDDIGALAAQLLAGEPTVVAVGPLNDELKPIAVAGPG